MHNVNLNPRAVKEPHLACGLDTRTDRAEPARVGPHAKWGSTIVCRCCTVSRARATSRRTLPTPGVSRCFSTTNQRATLAIATCFTDLCGSQRQSCCFRSHRFCGSRALSSRLAGKQKASISPPSGWETRSRLRPVCSSVPGRPLGGEPEGGRGASCRRYRLAQGAI
jgi:hypothetical protein